MRHTTAKGGVSCLDQKKNVRKRVIWAIISFLLAVASVVAVIWQSRTFKWSDFVDFVLGSNPLLIAAAVVCMLLYILFEGEALLVIFRSFGTPVTHRSAAFYSATDIYFSAITPSATGGQPASAFMMMRDGIPGSTTTVVLLANIVMYTASTLVIGLVAFLVCPQAFLNFDGVSRVCIYVGIGAQSCLLLFFVLLLQNEKLLRKLAIGALKLGGKLHLVRRVDERVEKIGVSLDNYARDVQALRGRRVMLFKVFFLNVAQRFAQISVTSLVFLAMGLGGIGGAVNVFALQCYVVLGASYMPIPGAMGVTDFLMLDAFSTMSISEEAATSLELISRSLSFYCCIALCAIVVLVRLLSWKKKSRD